MKYLYLFACSMLAAVSANAQILQQNFTSANGTTPPVGWTATDAAGAGVNWVFNNPGGQMVESPMSGNVAIIDSDFFGSSGVPEEAYLTSPVFDASALSGNLILSFDHTFSSAGTAEWAVEVYDGVTWTEVASGFDDIDTPENVYLDISFEAGLSANAQVRFHWTGEWDYYWMVDNVLIFDETCPQVTGLTASAVTSSGATASWTAGGSETAWLISYGLEGFDPAEGTIEEIETDPEFVITGLNTGQTYEFYVQADCDANGTSIWTGPYTFTTTCAPAAITSLPYAQNFNSVTVPALPCGWTKENTTSDDQEWTTEEWDTGNNFMVLYYNTDGVTPSNDWAISPEFVLQAGTNYVLSFEAMSGGLPENLTIGLGSTASGAAMTTTLLDLPGYTDGEFTNHLAYFTVPANGSYFIGFHGHSDANMFALGIDNFSLDLAPDCPAVTTASISAIVGENATVSWSAGLSETEWIVEYGEAGFDLGTGETVSATTTPTTILEDLESGTDYEVYIYAVCSATEESEAFGPITFTSQCVLPVVTDYPWTEDFETAEIDEMPCGWIQHDANADSFLWAVSDIQPSTGDQSLRIGYNFEEEMNDWAITPGFEMAAGVEYTISFDYSVYSETYPESFELFVGNGQTVASMTTSLQDFPDVANETYESVTVSFTPTTAGVYYFGFHGYSIAGQWDLFIDDVVVEENCEEENANVVYSENMFCTYSNPTTPAVTGTTGGTFSAPPGLSIDASTGSIAPGASTPGTYVVTYVSSTTGCADTVSISIVISECLSVEESALAVVELYPNPTKGNLILNISQPNVEANYSVTDLTGKLVLHPRKIDGSQTSINLSNEADGVYFVNFVSGEQSKSFRVVLSK